MNIRRQFFTRSTALSGAALLTLPNLGSPSPDKSDNHKRRPSKALEVATQASVVDSYKHKNGDPYAYVASATASIRLMAAMFEDQNEIGATAKDEAYLLSHQNAVRHFEPTPSFLQSLQSQLITLGVEIATQDIFDHTSPDQSKLEDHLEQVKAWGLGLFYRNAVQAISSKALGEMSTVACSPAYKSTKSTLELFSSIELDYANRDTLECATIFASLTENTAAATVFTLWSLVER